MLPEAHADIERLLRDGAWFARITHALLARDDSDVDAPAIPDGPRHPLSAPSLSEVNALAELRFELIESVLALAEPWRSAVLLRYLEGQRLARICEITCVPEFVARRRLRRGLAWIRMVLRMKCDGGGGLDGGGAS